MLLIQGETVNGALSALWHSNFTAYGVGQILRKCAPFRILLTLIGETGASMPLMFTLLFGGLVLAAGGAIDVANIMRVRSNIQNMADSAALAGASQYRLANSDPNVVQQVALSFANSALSSASIDGEPTVTVNDADRSVRVSISAKAPLHFIRLGTDAAYSVNSNAVARAGSSSVICLLALGDQSANLGIDNGRVTAPKCNAHSNSRATDGLVASGLSTASAKVICTSGGFSGSPTAFDPAPTTDCPEAADPWRRVLRLRKRSAISLTTRSRSVFRHSSRASIAGAS